MYNSLVIHYSLKLGINTPQVLQIIDQYVDEDNQQVCSVTNTLSGYF